MQNVDRWTKPSLYSLIAAPGLVELVDLFLEYGQNGRRRVACLELGGERMCEESLSRLFFVCLESFFEDDLKSEEDAVSMGGFVDGPGAGE
jgi:hypothetical protein